MAHFLVGYEALFCDGIWGHYYSVQVSDVAALPIQLGAALRHRRLFHPAGVLANGTLERVAPAGEGLPMESCDVIARISKGVGLPGSLPDIAGLALRIPPTPDLRSCTPWDVLLASTLGGLRIGLAPTRSWSNSTFTSLMPLRFHGTVWWLRARFVTTLDEPGLSLRTVSDQIDSGKIEFDIEQAAPMRRFTPLARVKLLNVDPSSDDIGFDPVRHCHDEVRPAPRWLSDFRSAAYRRSRKGRSGAPSA